MVDVNTGWDNVNYSECMEYDVKKVVVKILQGSVVTQTMLGGQRRLTIYPPVANFLYSVCGPKIMKIGYQWTTLFQIGL